MTGLDPPRDVIVEIATLVTDDDLAIVAEGPDLVVHQTRRGAGRHGRLRREMHTRSGLLEPSGLDRLARGGRRGHPRLHPAARARGRHRPAVRATPSAPTAASWPPTCPTSRTTCTTGRVDVSSVKELARRWYPEVRAGRPSKDGRPPRPRRHPRQRGGAPLLPPGLRPPARHAASPPPPPLAAEPGCARRARLPPVWPASLEGRGVSGRYGRRRRRAPRRVRPPPARWAPGRSCTTSDDVVAPARWARRNSTPARSGRARRSGRPASTSSTGAQ